MSLAFDWTTFVSSVSTAVLIALVIDWAKDTSRSIIKKAKEYLVKWWRGK